MNGSDAIRPTDAELNILNVLWRLGPSTVRDVHGAISQLRQTGYTTVLKLMQIMAAKGLVLRDETRRAHIYRPRFSQDDMQRALVGDLMERAFGGSAMKLVLHSLTSKRASADELREIRAMIEHLEAASLAGTTSGDDAGD